MSASKLSVRRRLAGAVGGVVSVVLTEARRRLSAPAAPGRQTGVERLEERLLFMVWTPASCWLNGGYSSFGSTPPGVCTTCPCINEITQSDPAASGGAISVSSGSMALQVGSSTPAAVEDTAALARYFDGQPNVEATDLTSDAFGKTWSQARSYDDAGTSYATSQGPSGNRWDVMSMPHLAQGVGSAANPSQPTMPVNGFVGGSVQPTFTSNAPTIIAVSGGSDQRVYDSSDNGATYSGEDFVQDKLYHNTSTDEYVLADATGGQSYFYGFGSGVPDLQKG